MTYIHTLDPWPIFTWNNEKILSLIARLRHQQGRLLGKMELLGFNQRNEAILQTLTKDVLKSSEIEGEILNPTSVRSSVARRLGLEAAGLNPVDRHLEGVVDMTMDASHNYENPVTKERLFSWHASLFPTGQSGLSKITVGRWRDGPMQVVSGYLGKEKIHFEAPSSERVDGEMQLFLKWLNKDTDMDLILKSGIAHLWFVTIHPFDDGNGRIVRALIDLLLARSENSTQRFYSFSAQIQKERMDYYHNLEQSQKGELDITSWLEWYLSCLTRAMENTDDTIDSILYKAQFWQAYNDLFINERQRMILNRLLDGEFFGNLTTSKWAKMSKCSQDTAHRDIQDLMNKDILMRNVEGGRSTSYRLKAEKL